MFEVGEKYISGFKFSDVEIGEVVICSAAQKFKSEFYAFRQNIKFTIYRDSYPYMHEILENEQFKNQIFVFEASSVNFNVSFYEKIVKFGSGDASSRYITKNTTYLVSDSTSGSTLRLSAKDKKIPIIKERKFWEMYYQS